jgi:hypothetical protein
MKPSTYIGCKIVPHDQFHRSKATKGLHIFAYSTAFCNNKKHWLILQKEAEQKTFSE